MADAPVPGQNPDVAWAIQDLKERAPALKRRRDYYEGRHLSVIPPGNTLSPLLAELLRDLADNLCDDVVDETVDRLEVLGWTTPDTDDTDDTDATEGTSTNRRAQLANDLWDRNRGPHRERGTYRHMGWAGDAYNIVERRDDGRVLWFPQEPEQMAVRYREDDPDTLEVAAKVWRHGKGYRLNLYYGPSTPDSGDGRLERYATRGTGVDQGIPGAKSFEPITTLRADGEVDDGARELWTRCPVFHFPAEEVGRYGRSVLTDVIPLQDLLNKAIADLVADMEELALPQRWGTGIQTSIDPNTGEELPLRRRAKRSGDMLTTAKDSASFGQFDGVDPTPFLAVIQAWRVEIARKGYLPPHSVGQAHGDVSGLSLLVQEGRQVKRCKAVGHRDAGWVWREQMAFMLTLAGTPTEPEDLDLEWAPVATRDEQALWELLTLKEALGVPRHVLLTEAGYDPDEVAEWLEAEPTMAGGRLSQPGPGIASVTMPGVPGGFGVPAPPVQPAGAAAPALPQG